LTTSATIAPTVSSTASATTMRSLTVIGESASTSAAATRTAPLIAMTPEQGHPADHPPDGARLGCCVHA
jgi:hypothetical protein